MYKVTGSIRWRYCFYLIKCLLMSMCCHHLPHTWALPELKCERNDGWSHQREDRAKRALTMSLTFPPHIHSTGHPPLSIPFLISHKFPVAPFASPPRMSSLSSYPTSLTYTLPIMPLLQSVSFWWLDDTKAHTLSWASLFSPPKKEKLELTGTSVCSMKHMKD